VRNIGHVPRNGISVDLRLAISTCATLEHPRSHARLEAGIGARWQPQWPPTALPPDQDQERRI